MFTTKTIVIGLNPSRVANKVRKNSAYDRLCQWIDYLNIGVVSFTNLSDDPEWDFKHVDTDRLINQIKGYNKVLALGGQVSKTLNTLGVDHFALPHPSPRNRMMNNPKNVSYILQKCKFDYYGKQK